MSSINPDIEQAVRQWMDYAEEDLRLAEYALNMKEQAPFRLIAYHAQQCAEKYLKAILVLNQIEFPYTHNLKSLVKLVKPLGAWPDILEQAEKLTPYAITTRYPGIDSPVDKNEALEALSICRQIRELLRTSLLQALP